MPESTIFKVYSEIRRRYNNVPILHVSPAARWADRQIDRADRQMCQLAYIGGTEKMRFLDGSVPRNIWSE